MIIILYQNYIAKFAKNRKVIMIIFILVINRKVIMIIFILAINVKLIFVKNVKMNIITNIKNT